MLLRKWPLAAALLCISCMGCITQHQQKVTDPATGQTITQTKSEVTIPFLTKEKKADPKVETILAYAKYQEDEARQSQTLTQAQRERLFDNARMSYQRALEKDPDNPKALLGLGRVYGSLNNYDRAEKIFASAMEKHPKNANLWFGKGRYHSQREEHEQAVHCFQQALQLDPENRDCAATLGYSLLMAKRTNEGFEVFKKLYGDEARAHYRVALMMTWQKDWSSARHHAQLALRHDPMNANARNILVRLEKGPDTLPRQERNPVVNVGFQESVSSR